MPVFRVSIRFFPIPYLVLPCFLWISCTLYANILKLLQFSLHFFCHHISQLPVLCPVFIPLNRSSLIESCTWCFIAVDRIGWDRIIFYMKSVAHCAGRQLHSTLISALNSTKYIHCGSSAALSSPSFIIKKHCPPPQLLRSPPMCLCNVDVSDECKSTLWVRAQVDILSKSANWHS